MADDPRKRQRRTDGRYEKSPACRGCGKPCDVDHYASHPMTNCTGDDSERWDDIAIVLCDRCLSYTDHMRNASEFRQFRDTGWY